MEIVTIAREHQVVIFEDDVLGPLHGSMPPPLAQFGPDVVWYIQSLSKCMALGLKIAYLVGPSAKHVQNLVQPVTNHSFWFPSALAADVATRLIESGRARKISEAIASLSEQRQRITRRVLQKIPFHSASGGLHVWIPLPSSLNAREFVSMASAAGVQIRPASMFAVCIGELDRRIPEAVRVAVTSPETDEELTLGLERLTSLLFRVVGEETHSARLTS
ncbi:hypothetical protein VP03_26935 [Sinorhizobium meliloti]|nr:hypothetical protein VP03_26935 [Sinorhizobium meliloti]